MFSGNSRECRRKPLSADIRLDYPEGTTTVWMGRSQSRAAFCAKPHEGPGLPKSVPKSLPEVNCLRRLLASRCTFLRARKKIIKHREWLLSCVISLVTARSPPRCQAGCRSTHGFSLSVYESFPWTGRRPSLQVKGKDTPNLAHLISQEVESVTGGTDSCELVTLSCPHRSPAC